MSRRKRGGHGVERLFERSHLVARLNLDAMRKVAAVYALSSFVKFGDGFRHAAREPCANNQSNQLDDTEEYGDGHQRLNEDGGLLAQLAKEHVVKKRGPGTDHDGAGFLGAGQPVGSIEQRPEVEFTVEAVHRGRDFPGFNVCRSAVQVLPRNSHRGTRTAQIDGDAVLGILLAGFGMVLRQWNPSLSSLGG